MDGSIRRTRYRLTPHAPGAAIDDVYAPGAFLIPGPGLQGIFPFALSRGPRPWALCIHGQAESQGRRAAGKNLLCLACKCYTIESLTSKESNHETRYHLQGA